MKIDEKSLKNKEPQRTLRLGSYRPAQSLQVTGQHLDLATILVRLLLSYTQGFCIAIGCIWQVSKLCNNTHGKQWCQGCNHKLWISAAKSETNWPWIGTTPPSPACWRRPWSRIGPWSLSEQWSGLVWTHLVQRGPAEPWSALVTHAPPAEVLMWGRDLEIHVFTFFLNFLYVLIINCSKVDPASSFFKVRSYLIMNPLQEVYFILQGIDLSLQLDTSQSCIIHVLEKFRGAGGMSEGRVKKSKKMSVYDSF